MGRSRSQVFVSWNFLTFNLEKSKVYRKLNCPGHEVNEREDLVQDFINAVKEFVNDKENGR